MQTLNDFINTYQMLNSVFNGVDAVFQGREIHSDGENLFIDGANVDTVKNKKQQLEMISKRVTELLDNSGKAGIKVIKPEDYYLIRDLIDGMVLLVNNKEDKLNILYNESSNIIFEQIDKAKGLMKFTHISSSDDKEPQANTYQLSAGSMELIKQIDSQNEFHFSQNDFYDMLPEGIKDFEELKKQNVLISKKEKV